MPRPTDADTPEIVIVGETDLASALAEVDELDVTVHRAEAPTPREFAAPSSAPRRADNSLLT